MSPADKEFFKTSGCFSLASAMYAFFISAAVAVEATPKIEYKSSFILLLIEMIGEEDFRKRRSKRTTNASLFFSFAFFSRDDVAETRDV